MYTHIYAHILSTASTCAISTFVFICVQMHKSCSRCRSFFLSILCTVFTCHIHKLDHARLCEPQNVITRIIMYTFCPNAGRLLTAVGRLEPSRGWRTFVRCVMETSTEKTRNAGTKIVWFDFVQSGIINVALSDRERGMWTTIYMIESTRA